MIIGTHRSTRPTATATPRPCAPGRGDLPRRRAFVVVKASNPRVLVSRDKLTPRGSTRSVVLRRDGAGPTTSTTSCGGSARAPLRRAYCEYHHQFEGRGPALRERRPARASRCRSTTNPPERAQARVAPAAGSLREAEVVETRRLSLKETTSRPGDAARPSAPPAATHCSRGHRPRPPARWACSQRCSSSCSLVVAIVLSKKLPVALDRVSVRPSRRCCSEGVLVLLQRVGAGATARGRQTSSSVSRRDCAAHGVRPFPSAAGLEYDGVFDVLRAGRGGVPTRSPTSGLPLVGQADARRLVAARPTRSTSPSTPENPREVSAIVSAGDGARVARCVAEQRQPPGAALAARRARAAAGVLLRAAGVGNERVVLATCRCAAPATTPVIATWRRWRGHSSR